MCDTKDINDTLGDVAIPRVEPGPDPRQTPNSIGFRITYEVAKSVGRTPLEEVRFASVH